VYNNYRADIATLFPGLANSLGAVGYFYLDTTGFENGVHSIAWSVTDDNGDVDGIGSRYFTVENAGAAPAATAAAEAASVESGAFALPHKRIPRVYLRTGFDDSAVPVPVEPGEDGAFAVGVQPSGRIVILLDPEAAGVEDDVAGKPRAALRAQPRGGLPADVPGARYLGYQIVGSECRALPAGSSFDPESGTFSWQPGPGFLGRYDLAFIQRSGRLGLDKAVIRAVISVK
jgi:hypothetical protein